MVELNTAIRFTSYPDFPFHNYQTALVLTSLAVCKLTLPEEMNSIICLFTTIF